MLEALQKWYADQCDGDWEHRYGVTLESLDNPGWRLFVDLAGTDLEGRVFPAFEDMTSDTEWITCRVSNDRFEAACGPTMLAEVLERFLSWANE